MHGFKALYLFSGKARKSDIGALLRDRGWEVLEMDILRDKAHDITLEKVQVKVRGWIRDKVFRALLASPPCDSFTRAKMANCNGPRPVRDFDNPRGLPHLTWAEKRTVMLANSLVDFTLELFELHCRGDLSVAVLEHPEDLGAVTHGPFYQCRPASIWQFPALLNVLKLPGVITVGLRQCDFGTPYVKPTRLLLKVFANKSPLFFEGLPSLDSMGFYQGPIPRSKGHTSLVRRRGDVGFRTTGTAAWPVELCKVLAAQLSVLPSGGVVFCSDTRSANEPKSVQDPGPSATLGSVPVVIPPQDYWMGGVGRVRSYNLLGKERDFHDGAGLTSPGRWDKDKRCFPEGARWDQLRTSLQNVLRTDLDELGLVRLFSCLATGRDIHFDNKWPEEMRAILHGWMQKQCGDYTRGPAPLHAEGQPFFLDLMFFLGREMRDPDYQVLLELQVGVSAGILEPLPLVPAIFEEQTKWRLVEDPFDLGMESNPNYKSVEGFKEEILKQFGEDELEGRMVEMSERAFRSKYGQNVAISALAVLEEKDKLRILHDATHVTKVNHKIKVRGRLRMPTARGKFYLLDQFRSRSCIAVSMMGDVSKRTDSYVSRRRSGACLHVRLSQAACG